MRDRILICLSASDDFVGRFIRWITQSQFNHVFILYESSLWGGWWAAQITPEKGIHKIPANHLEDVDRIECYEGVGTGHDISKGLKTLRDAIGIKYDYLGVWNGLLRAIIMRLFGKKIPAIHSSKRMFCFEFVIRVLQEAGIPGIQEYSPVSTPPRELRKFLIRSATFKSVNSPL